MNENRAWLVEYWATVITNHNRPYPKNYMDTVLSSVQFLSDTEVDDYVAVLKVKHDTND
jgi:hypothetical protein